MGVCASEGPPPILQPRTYRSASGAFSVHVNPSDLHGRGPASYRFARNGRTVSTNRFPFTLWEAKVADSGHVAGYAYSHGWRGFSDAGYEAGMGTFSVVLISSQGKIVCRHEQAREHSRFMHTPPNPLASGVLLNEHRDRFSVRVAGYDRGKGEQWWQYDLASGERTGRVEPEPYMNEEDAHLWVIDAQTIPDTPLTLVHWWRYKDPLAGAVFSLVDPEAKPEWTLELHDDYTLPGDEDAEGRLRARMRDGGAIISVGRKRFEVGCMREGKRVTFAVEPADDGNWTVQERLRRDYRWEPVTPTRRTLAMPEAELRHLGVICLDQRRVASRHPVRDVSAFDLDDKGRICFVRAVPRQRPVAVLLSHAGGILGEVPFGERLSEPGATFSGPACVGGGRFVIAETPRETGLSARCYVVNCATRSAREVDFPPGLCVAALAGFPDGQFAALTKRYHKYGITDGLYVFGKNGRVVRHREQGGYGGERDDLLSPEDIVACGTNTLAVLDNIRHTVQVFTRDGRLERFVDLEQTWRREPSYPTGIAVDGSCGFVVYDFDAEWPVVRMDRQGRIVSQCVPAYSDGRPVDVIGGVRCASDGGFWVSDRHSILHLSPSGIVDRVLGEPMAVQTLAKPDAVAVSFDGRVCISDERTHAVHVFAPSGRRTAICRPDARDLRAVGGIERLVVSGKGDIYASLGCSGETYLRFRPDGTRVGRLSTDVDAITQEWHFQPSNDLCWIVGYNDVFLVRDLEQVECRLARRADGHWLAYPGEAGVAPDGSLAVTASERFVGGISVNTYGPQGRPVATFSLPGELSEGWRSPVFDGEHLFIREGDVLFAFTRDGKPLSKLTLGEHGGRGDWSGPFLTGDGREFRFVDTHELVVHRYAVPAFE
jgi:sugar lactone lactonase YvrE